MDGENNGSKPYEQMDDLGGNTPIFGMGMAHHSINFQIFQPNPPHLWCCMKAM